MKKYRVYDVAAAIYSGIFLNKLFIIKNFLSMFCVDDGDVDADDDEHVNVLYVIISLSI